jgi:hypothetical protein
VHIGDAGQSRLEEVDLVRHGAKGRNFGWRRKEGTFCYTPATHCLANRTVAVSSPIIVYGRSAGSSVTGGYLNRGTAIPTFAGRYVFADAGRARSSLPPGALTENKWTRSTLLSASRPIFSFGKSRGGKLLAVDFRGAVLRPVDA